MVSCIVTTDITGVDRRDVIFFEFTTKNIGTLASFYKGNGFLHVMTEITGVDPRP